MMYAIRPEDERLIEAAIGLGDWIVAQPGITVAQRAAVEALQDALRGLPSVPPPMVAEYGFHVRTEPAPGKGLYRAWRVSLSPSGLEIYSVYSPDEPIEFEEKVSHELNFWLRPSRPCGHDGYYFKEWIEEVSDPIRFREPDALFGIVAELERIERN